MSKLLLQRIFSPSRKIVGQQVAHYARKVYYPLRPKPVEPYVYANFDALFASIENNPPNGVSQGFFADYLKLMNSMTPKAFNNKKVVVKLQKDDLYQATKKIQSREDLELTPDLIERWRRRALPYDHSPTYELFKLADQFNAPEIMFKLLENNHRYGLVPRTTEFNRLLKVYSREAPHLVNGTSDLAEIEPWGEKMIMVYGLMPYYKCIPDQFTANIIISSLLKSPLASLWGIRIAHLARELSQKDIVFSDEILQLIVLHRSKYNEAKAEALPASS